LGKHLFWEDAWEDDFHGEDKMKQEYEGRYKKIEEGKEQGMKKRIWKLLMQWKPKLR
jgi:hypothetical protein